MKQDYSHITYILDRSGSMAGVWNDVIGGFKTLIQDQKKEVGECTFSLVAFDTEYEVKQDFVNILDASEEIDFRPRGGTALYDALGKAITELGEKLAAMDEDKKPSKTLIFCQSDGEENSSREFTSETIKELVKRQTEVYNWQFMFLGADEKCLDKAVQNMGININMAATYGSAGAMCSGSSQKMSQMRSMSADLYSTGTMAFTEGEKEDLLS